MFDEIRRRSDEPSLDRPSGGERPGAYAMAPGSRRAGTLPRLADHDHPRPLRDQGRRGSAQGRRRVGVPHDEAQSPSPIAGGIALLPPPRPPAAPNDARLRSPIWRAQRSGRRSCARRRALPGEGCGRRARCPRLRSRFTRGPSDENVEARARRTTAPAVAPRQSSRLPRSQSSGGEAPRLSREEWFLSRRACAILRMKVGTYAGSRKGHRLKTPPATEDRRTVWIAAD
jgi:hypothetical protein